MSLRNSANKFMKMRKKVGLSNTLGRRRVLVGLGIQSEIDLDIYQGVVDYFSPGGSYDVVPIGVDFERRVGQLVARGGVDGVIGEFAGGDWLTALQRQGIPVVHIRQNFAVGGVPSVGIDYRVAGEAGGRFLAERGVGRIIWLGSGVSLVAREVLAGQRAAFAGEIRQMSLEAFLHNPRVGRGSCVCFAELRLSAAIVRAIRRARLNIPRDIALLSYGHSVQASLWSGLDLCAIPFPWRQVGRSAAAKLAELFKSTVSVHGRKKGTGLFSEMGVVGGDLLAPTEVYRGGSVERVGEGHVVVSRALALAGERMEDGLRVGEVARLLGVSRRKLEMAFRDCGKGAPHGEFEALRMERAVRLLEETRLGVGEIGRRCGYSSVHAFSAAFKRARGESPRRIRNLHLQRGGEVS